MDLVTVVIVLIAVGLLVWAVQAYLPMLPQPFRHAVCFVLIVLLVLWLLNSAGVVHHHR